MIKDSIRNNEVKKLRKKNRAKYPIACGKCIREGQRGYGPSFGKLGHYHVDRDTNLCPQYGFCPSFDYLQDYLKEVTA